MLTIRLEGPTAREPFPGRVSLSLVPVSRQEGARPVRSRRTGDSSADRVPVLSLSLFGLMTVSWTRKSA